MNGIPFISKVFLDQIGPESEKSPWKNDFYYRQIQQPVYQFIQQDFEIEEDSTLLNHANEILRFVNNVLDRRSGLSFMQWLDKNQAISNFEKKYDKRNPKHCKFAEIVQYLAERRIHNIIDDIELNQIDINVREFLLELDDHQINIALEHVALYDEYKLKGTAENFLKGIDLTNKKDARQRFEKQYEKKQRKGTLGEALNKFDNAMRPLPGVVTIDFGQIPNRKAQAKLAYENLILLETIYYVEKLVENERQKGTLSFDWQEVNSWVTKLKVNLAPISRKNWLSKVRYAVLGTAIEEAWGWAVSTVPYLITSYVMMLSKVCRNFPRTQRGVLGNGYDLLHFILLNGFIAASFILLPMIQVYRILARLTSLPFEGTQKLFQKLCQYLDPKDSSPFLLIGILQFFKNIILLKLILMPILPLALQAIIYSTGLCAFSALAVGSFIFGLHHLLNAAGIRVSLIQNESLLKLDLMQILFFCGLIFGATPSRMVRGIKALAQLLAEQEKLDQHALSQGFNDPEKHNVNNIVLRKAHLENYKEWLQKYNNFIDGHWGYIGKNASFSNEVKKMEQSLGLHNLQPIVVAQPDYDRQALIVRVMRLRADLENTEKTHGVEVVNTIRNINPITYLAQFNSIEALPEALRQFTLHHEENAPSIQVEQENVQALDEREIVRQRWINFSQN